jgi:serine/threonine protein kinase
MSHTCCHSACPCENKLVGMIEDTLTEQERDAVHRHLDVCPDCARLMVELAHLLAPAVPQLGRRYTLRGVIGQGATSIVHLAWDAHTRREVAVKRARLCGADDATRAALHHRFAVEATLLAQVHHPNLVRLLDVCSSPAGESCLVLELVRGPTMTAWLAQAPRPWAAIVQRYLGAGAALQALHAAGIVHRDFKPDNLIVCEDAVKLVDLGLASTFECAPERVGTPCYMAPEQHEIRRPRPAADQFSFCAALWESLTGQRPFAGRTVDELCDAVRAQRLAAPPPHLPAPLIDALRRGLRPRPEDRWHNMATLCDALCDALPHVMAA